jgi:hypothetical protein
MFRGVSKYADNSAIGTPTIVARKIDFPIVEGDGLLTTKGMEKTIDTTRKTRIVYRHLSMLSPIMVDLRKHMIYKLFQTKMLSRNYSFCSHCAKKVGRNQESLLKPLLSY